MGTYTDWEWREMDRQFNEREDERAMARERIAKWRKQVAEEEAAKNALSSNERGVSELPTAGEKRP